MSLEVAAFCQYSAREEASEFHRFLFNFGHIFLNAVQKFLSLIMLNYKVCSIDDISVREGHGGTLWLIQVSNNTTYDLNVFSCGERRA